MKSASEFLFTAQHSDFTISLVSEYHHHPSVMNLSTYQDITLGQKNVHVHQVVGLGLGGPRQN